MQRRQSFRLLLSGVVGVDHGHAFRRGGRIDHFPVYILAMDSTDERRFARGYRCQITCRAWPPREVENLVEGSQDDASLPRFDDETANAACGYLADVLSIYCDRHDRARRKANHQSDWGAHTVNRQPCPTARCRGRSRGFCSGRRLRAGLSPLLLRFRLLRSRRREILPPSGLRCSTRNDAHRRQRRNDNRQQPTTLHSNAPHRPNGHLQSLSPTRATLQCRGFERERTVADEHHRRQALK
jgi:hypothetical protein